MNRHNGTGKTKVKTSFYNLCMMYKLDYDAMLLIAEQAKVMKEVIDAMFIRWFERHGIAIHELPNTHVWQLGPEPTDPRPKTSKMHGGC